jgi:glycosyltransferase involved in cell wall biosynthesis
MRARRIIKEVHPDLIITFLFHDTLNVGLAGLTQFKRPRLIVGRRSPIGYGDNSRDRIHRFTLRIIYKFADLAVSNSCANIESAINDGIKEGKIRVIENFVAQNNLSEVRTNDKEPLEILCIANFHWYKNHEGLLRAVATIPNHEKKFHITFVGDGPLLDEVRQLVSELKISCEFRGFMDDPSSVIPLFHAIILASHVEGSSNALLEGLICGIPAVVSKVGAAQELLSQGAPLILCDSYDVTSIASALIQLRNNYETLRTDARDFSKILIQNLSEDTVFKKWQDVIRVVTSS